MKYTFTPRLRTAKHLLFSLSVLLTACSKNIDTPATPPGTTPGVHADDLPATDNTTPNNVHIGWDATATKVSHNTYFAEYPRMVKLGGDTLLLTYHFGPLNNEWDNIGLRKSFDGGVTWSAVETIMQDNNPNYYGFSNPFLAVLKNGSIMLAYTGRGNPDDNFHDNIQVRISNDRGQTWGAPIIAATGRSWEPAAVQLSNGEIQMFYSSEAAWWPGSNIAQEIRMTSSTDNGLTWSSSKRVAYDPGLRDGMATPLVLKDNKGIVFPIESVGNSKSPWILWSSMEANWNYASHGTVSNNRRWLATSENVWGGAPYMVQTQSGETILSLQDAGGRAIGSEWKKSTMVVLVGNSVAKNFTNKTAPFPNLPVNEGAYYSSLFLKDNNTVIILSTRNFSDNHSEIYMKTGHITR